MVNELFCKMKGARGIRSAVPGLLAAGMAGAAPLAKAQNYQSAGISAVFVAANQFLQRGDYRSAVPALQEVVARTKASTNPQVQATCQTCRFHLAQAYFQTGGMASGMMVLEDYLANEPKTEEPLALRMQAQGFFDVQEWDKVEASAQRLLDLPRLSDEDEYNGNLLLGQALFRQERWVECIGTARVCRSIFNR